MNLITRCTGTVSVSICYHKLRSQHKMQKQQLRNEDVDTGVNRGSRRQAAMPTCVAEGRIKAEEAACAAVQVAVEKVAVRQSVRSFRTTANFSGSRWFLDLYLIHAQTKSMLF